MINFTMLIRIEVRTQGFQYSVGYVGLASVCSCSHAISKGGLQLSDEIKDVGGRNSLIGVQGLQEIWRQRPPETEAFL